MSALPLSALHCVFTLSALPLSALHCVLTLSALPLSALHCVLTLSALPLSALHCPLFHCPLFRCLLLHCPLFHCAARDAADRVPTIKIVSDCQHLFLFVRILDCPGQDTEGEPNLPPHPTPPCRILACPGVVQQTACPPFNLISPLHQRVLSPPVVGIRLYIWTRHIPYGTLSTACISGPDTRAYAHDRTA